MAISQIECIAGLNYIVKISFPIIINIRKNLVFSFFLILLFCCPIFVFIYGVISGNFGEVGELIMYSPFFIMVPLLLLFKEKFVYKYVFDTDKIILYKIFGKKIIYIDQITRITLDTLDRNDQVDIHYKKSRKDYTKIVSIHRSMIPYRFNRFCDLLRKQYEQ